MTSIGTKDPRIDVKELAQRVRDRVERMSRAENFKPLGDEFDSKTTLVTTKAQPHNPIAEHMSVTADDLASEIVVMCPAHLATGKKMLAPLVMKLHRLADSEVRMLMEPTILRQARFDMQVVASFRNVQSDLASLTTRLSDIERSMQVVASFRNVQSDLASLTTRLSDIERSMQVVERKAQLIARTHEEELLIQYPVGVKDERLVVNERIVEEPFVFSNLPRRAKRILDVGCTESYLAIQLASLGFSVYGIDVRDYRLSHPNFHFVRDDISSTPFPDEYFDVVLAISSIEHIGFGHYKDPLHDHGDVGAIKEIYRVLEKGGTFIMSVPFASTATKTWERVYDEESLTELLTDFTIEKMTYWTKKDEHWVSATLEDVKKQNVDIGALGPYPLWPCIATLIARKLRRAPG